MLRMLQYSLLFLLVCSIALPARGAEKKQEKKKDEAKAVIAVFTFDKAIAEKPSGEQFPLFTAAEPPSLKDLVERMKKAKDDKNVKAVVLLMDETDVSPGAVRGALPGDRRDQGGGQGSVRPYRRGADDAFAGAGGRGLADQRDAHRDHHDLGLQRRGA